MSTSPFQKKMRHPLWKQKREEILHRDNFSCAWCGSKSGQLVAHHLMYQPSRQPWEHDPSLMMCLCCLCHNKLTTLLGAIAYDINSPDYYYAARIFHELMRSRHSYPFVEETLEGLAKKHLRPYILEKIMRKPHEVL